MINYLKEYFENWNWWDWSWIIVASVVGTWLGIHFGGTPEQTAVSVVTMLTGLWCVILVAKGRIFNYYLGIINVIGYAYIAYGYQLYGEVQLNLIYFLPMQFYGLIIWSRNKDTSVKDKVTVKFMSATGRVAWWFISIVAVAIYAMWLEKLGDPLPHLDSASTILSIIAMMLMAWRYMEQWILWIIVDIVSVWMWYLTIDANGARDVAILVMWSAYLINAVYGFLMWIKMYKDQERTILHEYSRHPHV